MISFETAKALKEAGLQWKPQIGDWFYTNHRRYVHMVIDLSELQVQEDYVFDPRLDQLLAEIDKRGYSWELSLDDVDVPPYAICLVMPTRNRKWFTADTPEEAAAQALLWILRKGDEKCENL